MITASPVLCVQASDEKKTWFSWGAGWDLQQSRIVPEPLGREEVDAMLLEVGAFGRIRGKFHRRKNLYRFGAWVWGAGPLGQSPRGWGSLEHHSPRRGVDGDQVSRLLPLLRESLRPQPSLCGASAGTMTCPLQLPGWGVEQAPEKSRGFHRLEWQMNERSDRQNR